MSSAWQTSPSREISSFRRASSPAPSRRPIPLSELDTSAVQAQLSRVLESERFARANRARRLLSYLVASVLEHRYKDLKEYTLGIEVFDRQDSFDPRLETIVRVEAGRLRARLADYYATEGQDDPIAIEVPRGRYLPAFYHRMPAAPRIAVPAAADSLARLRRVRFGWTTAVTGTGVLLAIIAGVFR